MTTKWECRQEIYQGPEMLNKWGAEGWEVACTVGKDASFLIMKRPLVLNKRRSEATAETPSVAPSGPSSGPSRAEEDLSPRKKFKELI